MADASTDSPRGHDGPERRKLVDLIRAERGEPERRKLPRFGDPVITNQDEEPGGDESR